MRAIYKENDANFPRLKTDRLFVDFDARFDWTGNTDDLIKLVENVQLKDVTLWKRFVEQFRIHGDDRDCGWRSEFFGKLMRGGSFIWLYSRDEDLYRILTEAVEDMLTTQDDLGRFSAYSVENEFRGWDLWGRKYVLLGFQYYLEICRDEELAYRIVTAMQAHTDYLLERIGPKAGQVSITRTSDYWQGLNSCSILEPIVRLYSITKEPRYLDFACYIAETGGIENGSLVDLAYEGKVYPYQYPVTKAYELMSFFEGLLELYRVTGTEKYRIAVENLVRLIRETDITIIGCAGCTHELFDNSVRMQTDPGNTIHAQETCVTVTWMKLCMQLLCLNGDPTLADCMEISAYNALFGAVNTEGVTKNNGYIFDSYNPMMANKRGRATAGLIHMADGSHYGCCAAIGACGLGMVPRAACMLTEDGVTLNFYNDGTVRTSLPGGAPLTLTVSGGYPVNGDIAVRLDLEQEETFTLSLRVPAWSKKTALSVNGEDIPVTSTGYVHLQRLWKSGDTVSLSLDLRVRQFEQDGFSSFMRGPILLARDNRLGEDITFPMEVTYDEEGFVRTCPSSKAPFPAVLEIALLFPETDMYYGMKSTFVDYASAGKTWDCDSLTAAWLPMARPYAIQ